LEASLEHFKNETERTVFVIGGGEIYRQALALDCIDEMYISHVDHEFGADTFFPSIDQQQWVKKTLFQHTMDEKHLYAFETIHYTKKKNATK
jgi:dihydrofolate reductase